MDGMVLALGWRRGRAESLTVRDLGGDHVGGRSISIVKGDAGGHAAMVEPGHIFERLHREFFAALEACRVQPEEKAVHRLRTTTRRLEALLNIVKRRRNGGRELGLRIDKALQALRPVRRAAGPVRDMDVQRGLLDGLLKTAGAAMLVAERGGLKEEGEKLQAKLKKSRKGAATELSAVIGDVDVKDLERISLLQTDISKVKWMSLLKDAQAVERRGARRLHAADPESLHAYRKSSKSARYLAEMEEGSAPAEQFAKRMKGVLDAIGSWHDWMLLTQLAKKTVGKSSGLAKAVKKEREGALRRAVGAVERLHRQS
jgi:CHAD domain-containing protein